MHYNFPRENYTGKKKEFLIIVMCNLTKSKLPAFLGNVDNNSLQIISHFRRGSSMTHYLHTNFTIAAVAEFFLSSVIFFFTCTTCPRLYHLPFSKTVFLIIKRLVEITENMNITGYKLIINLKIFKAGENTYLRVQRAVLTIFEPERRDNQVSQPSNQRIQDRCHQ